MRKNDIIPGNEYGYASYPSSEPQRVRVIESGVARKAYSGYRDFRGHTNNDGWLVEYLDKNGETIMRGERKMVTIPGAQTVLPNGVITTEPETTEWVEGEPMPITRVVTSRQLVGTWEECAKAIETKHNNRVSLENFNKQYVAEGAKLATLLENAGVVGAKSYSVRASGRSNPGTPFYYSNVEMSLDALKKINAILEQAAKDAK